MSEKLVWIDCEMTGLDVVNDALIEVAVLVTDGDLNVLGDGVDVLITPTDEQLASMGDFVREMHTKSGLLDQVASGTTMDDAEAQVMDYVRSFVTLERRAPLAGNTIGTDRAFLARAEHHDVALVARRVVHPVAVRTSGVRPVLTIAEI